MSSGGFYKRALEAAEQLELDAAGELEGLREEIKVLRVRIADLAIDDGAGYSIKGGNMAGLLKALEVLAKLVSTHNRVSKGAERNLAENVRALYRELEEMVDLEEEPVI